MIISMATKPTVHTHQTRQTRQGAAVEAALAANDAFRSAQELFAQMRADGETVGLSTVYRQLNALAELDRADVVVGADGESRYRLCGVDSGSKHHHHLVCRECGTSVEVASSAVERWADDVAHKAGFTQVTHTLEVFGLCPKHSA